MALYLMKENSHKEKDSNNEEKFVFDSYSNEKEIVIEELEKYGFHFTPQENVEAISATGLKAKIGSNSKGGLGKEAIEKTFLSYGINGMMQLFNRLLCASYETPISAILETKEKSKYLLEYEKSKDSLSVIEGFEYVRKYMEDCKYFVIQIREPEYDKSQLNDESIKSLILDVNSNLDKITGITINHNLTSDEINRIENINKKYISDLEEKKQNLIFQSKKNNYQVEDKSIEKITKKQNNIRLFNDMILQNNDTENLNVFSVEKPKTIIDAIDSISNKLNKDNLEDRKILEKLIQIRAQITINIRRKSKEEIDKARGKVKPETLTTEYGANFERIDYNEDAVMWLDQKRYPHNVHTMIRDIDSGIEGIENPIGVRVSENDLLLVSVDGKKPANSLQVIKAIYENSNNKDRKNDFTMNMLNRNKDIMHIEHFLKYVEIYEKYKNNPEKFSQNIICLQDKIMEDFPQKNTLQKRKISDDDLKKFNNSICLDRNFEEECL